jgi:hypothetical protein
VDFTKNQLEHMLREVVDFAEQPFWMGVLTQAEFWERRLPAMKNTLLLAKRDRAEAEKKLKRRSKRKK